MAMQTVRKARRLASVCRRRAPSRAAVVIASAGGASARRAGAADALKIKVVIPDIAKNGTDLFLFARSAIHSNRYPVTLRLCFEIDSDSCPIIRSGGQRLRLDQRTLICSVE